MLFSTLKMKVLVAQSCLTLCDPMDGIARQAPLSVGFPRHEHWSGLPFPPPGDLPDPEIESPVSTTFLTAEPPGKLKRTYIQPKTRSSQSYKVGYGPRR